MGLSLVNSTGCAPYSVYRCYGYIGCCYLVVVVVVVTIHGIVGGSIDTV